VFDGVTVRMYEPVKRSGVLPGIMFFHGGGFVIGNLGKDCGKPHAWPHEFNGHFPRAPAVNIRRPVNQMSLVRWQKRYSQLPHRKTHRMIECVNKEQPRRKTSQQNVFACE